MYASSRTLSKQNKLVTDHVIVLCPFFSK